LKPYLPVIQIGQTTFGKDEAGLLIKDKRQPRQIFWTLQPVVFKLFNALNQGGYGTGIMPSIQGDELATLPLKPLSSLDDVLIEKALINIYGDNKVVTENLKPAKKIIRCGWKR